MMCLLCNLCDLHVCCIADLKGCKLHSARLLCEMLRSGDFLALFVCIWTNLYLDSACFKKHFFHVNGASKVRAFSCNVLSECSYTVVWLRERPVRISRLLLGLRNPFLHWTMVPVEEWGLSSTVQDRTWTTGFWHKHVFINDNLSSHKLPKMTSMTNSHGN